jgi:hypothetical protein
MTAERTETIPLFPLGDGSVRLEFHGEHHMGAGHVEIVLPFDVEGVHRLVTTNGTAFLSPRMRRLIVRDACVVLAIDPVTRAVAHWRPPAGWYIADFAEQGDDVVIGLYDATLHHRQLRIPIASLSLVDGIGPADRGRFPSAHPR